MATSLNPRQTTHYIVDPVTHPLWGQLVADKASTLFHSPLWMQVLEKTYGISLAACVLERDGYPVAGVPWWDQTGLLGHRRITLPFSDFCDPLSTTREEAATLAEVALKDGHPWTLRGRASSFPQVGAEVIQRSPFKWQGIDLAIDDQGIWNRMNSMAQRGVLKAQKNRVELRQATDKKELREWYILHLRLRKHKHHLLPQPYSFFEHIWDNFIEKGLGFLLLATHQEKLIGGTLFLFWRDTCYYKFNASDGNYLGLRPNNLLLWRGMMEAKERGYSQLDLGRSPVSQEGLIGFKRNFGAREEDLLSQTYCPEGLEVLENADARRLLQQLTQFFVRESVSDELSEEAANLLYKYFA